MIAQSRPFALVTPREEYRLEQYRLALAQSTLFHGLSTQAIDDVLRRCQVRHRAATAKLVEEGEPGDSVFVIVEGKVRAVRSRDNGQELTLASLGRGDFFGELALLDGRPRDADVVAIEPTTVLVLTREHFAAHLRSHPLTALNLLTEMAQRLRQANETISGLVLEDVNGRLVHTLVKLARAEGPAGPHGLTLSRRPTQQDLASMVGACRETVSRTLTSLIRRGLIIARGRSLVLTPALLTK